MPPGARPERLRRRLRVTGTVQGVGFRPFVYREAVGLALSGFVCNDSAGVLIEVEGSEAAVEALCEAVARRPPPLARIEAIDAVALSPLGQAGFRIVESAEGGEARVPVSVDVATCADCLAEVDDPADRRYRYPFTNCTNCGPRYTIVRSVPYDRPATTMAGFPMCRRCQEEYDDPTDRRFHAQPNSCPDCGPRLTLLTPAGEAAATAGDALERAVAALAGGRILAVKGIGGYHLAADATDDEAVAELRRRKARDDKPFAVMVADLATARELCDLPDGAAAALASPRRPIVLAPRRPAASSALRLSSRVAPKLPQLGLMLPYTPLHHLLLAGARRPLVMTSGNLSDDPIAHLDGDAVTRLGPLVDAILAHDRPIHVRCDDSVVRSCSGRTQSLRRSRGFAPEPLRLPSPALRPVLAVGAELKSTVAVAKGTTLVASHHIGDLEHLAAFRSFLQATDHLCHLYGVEPEIVVHDLHPEYLSTKHALDLDAETWGVQHHHAHVASCLAEHGRRGPALGIAFDGLGYGTDGTLWGGELLVADLDGFERAGHLAPVPLPGGAAAIREPWRMALSWVAASLGTSAAAALGPTLDERWRGVLAVIESGTAPLTSSAGRLFDAVAAIAGVRNAVTYEGQAAIELEALAADVPVGEGPAFPVEVARQGATAVLDPRPLIAAAVTVARDGMAKEAIAAGLHDSLGLATAQAAATVAAQRDLTTICLTGGVFQNVRLTTVVEHHLRAAGFEVLLHGEVPPNDGGISVGQAAIGALATRAPVQRGA